MSQAIAVSKSTLSRKSARPRGLVDRAALLEAVAQSFAMLAPWRMARNPVMFVTEIGAALSSGFAAQWVWRGAPDARYGVWVSGLLWLTVLFANFAEALAEARGRAQAKSLRAARSTGFARVRRGTGEHSCPVTGLNPGDVVVVLAGEGIPADGEVIEGAASVDESAITGESAAVIREAGGDRSGVTGGTRLLSDRLVIRVTAAPGQSFLDRMIALVEGARRQKTPNEVALSLLLAGLTLGFLIVTMALMPAGLFFGVRLDVPTLVALLVCLIPTTIGGLLSAVGLAGMERAMASNLIAKSGKAVEVAGDVDTILMDKTGTITLGNRRAKAFLPVPGVEARELAEKAVLSSLGDGTPEGKSILELAHQEYGLTKLVPPAASVCVPFSAQTRMSGLDREGLAPLRKGAMDAVLRQVASLGGVTPPSIEALVESVSHRGATPLVVADGARILGVISLEDVLKPGIRDRITRLKAMGLRVVMITGDNRVTAEVIGAQAGVDETIAESRPEDKLAVIRREQAAGRLVAMIGDGTNDAPALAQADVGIAMNSGTQAAKEAANIVDLDSDPAKLVEAVEVGKQLLMTRGALTTFSIANDVAKYFAIIPALFVAALGELGALNLMGLSSPCSAVLSALLFNALVIPALIPVALRGVRYRPRGADALLFRNLMVWGVGGLALPFAGIKLIDLALSAFVHF